MDPFLNPVIEHIPVKEHIPAIEPISVLEHISIIEYISVIENISITEYISVLETRETREKTRTRIFGSGSGQVSLDEISGFSCHASGKPENSGRVGFRISSGFCTLYILL